MRRLMRLHRYLSCVAAPMMLFFAISGAWQVFRLHESRKDNSYIAPQLVAELSAVHKVDRLTGPGGVAFRVVVVLAALVFAASAVIGATMAAKVSRPWWMAWVLMGLGTVIPIVLFLTAGARPRGAPRGIPPGSAPPAMEEPEH